MKIKRALPMLLTFLLLLAFTGCEQKSDSSLPLQGKKIAIVVKSANNQYFASIAEGFQSVIEEHGGTVYLYEPSQATAEEQISIINDLISDKVDCIAIASNSEIALSSILEKAARQGIKVLSFDSAVEAAARSLHVNQANAALIAKTLMDAASDITVGGGQLAIVSTTNQAHNQNTWIHEIRELMENGIYPELTLVDIVFGEDDYHVTYEKTQYLLDTYPELHMVVAPTAAGLPAVAQCILDNGREQQVKVTGLGMPSQMEDYIETVCPAVFLWDLQEVGCLTAYAAVALVTETITGQVGDLLSAGELGVYQVTQDPLGGSEIVIKSEPLRFDAENMASWRGADW